MILSALTTAIEALIPEDLPGPWFTKILLILLTFTLFFFRKLKSKLVNLSKFSLLLLNSLVYDL